jgi:hypothetical protein
MKNNTLIRIKVPKALYESALRKALLEASDKATPEKVKASIQKQEKEKNKKTDDMIAKARAAKAIKEETSDTDGIADARFGPTRSERGMEKDSQNLGEKKKHMEESSLMQAFQSFKELIPFLIPLAGFLGLSVGIVKNMLTYMKDNNLKGMKGFIEAYNTVGKGVSGAADQAKGITEAKKKVDPKKAAEEKKKKEAEDKKKKEVEAKKAADKKKIAAAKKK